MIKIKKAIKKEQKTQQPTFLRYWLTIVDEYEQKHEKTKEKKQKQYNNHCGAFFHLF